VGAAVADASKRSGLDPSEIEILRTESVEWADTSLGCPQPDVAYLQVVTPGWRIVLQAANQSFEYHADAESTERLVLCASGV
jgi:hypothetical protein